MKISYPIIVLLTAITSISLFAPSVASGQLYYGYGWYVQPYPVPYYTRTRIIEVEKEKSWEEKAADLRHKWDIADEAKARRRANMRTMEDRLDAAQRLHDLKKREEKMREDGILPPKKKGGFVYNGTRYTSWDEFKNTDDFLRMKADAQIREIKRQIIAKEKEEKRQRAVEFLRERRSRSHITNVLMDERNRSRNIARKAMGEWWWKKYITEPEKYNEKYKEALKRKLPPGSYKSYEVLPMKK